MKLLMITRKVDRDDWLAGFAYQWVLGLARRLDSLTVICLAKGNIAGLPANVTVYSLGKEHGMGRWRRFRNFCRLAQKIVPSVDAIFCHMNPEYTIAVWPFARYSGKKIISWYAHSAVTWKTRWLAKIADKILTPSPESFRLPSVKTVITGHGIDTDLFVPPATWLAPSPVLRILTVGRIAPTKRQDILLLAVKQLLNRHLSVAVKIVGGLGLPKHLSYAASLQKLVKQEQLDAAVEFIGPTAHAETVGYYQQADVFVNLSGTGSLDKAVLEAMSCGCLVLTANEAFAKILPPELFLSRVDATLLADRLVAIAAWPLEQRRAMAQNLRQLVIEQHNLERLLTKVTGEISALV